MDDRVALELVPVRQRDAIAFVREHHRHSNPPRGDVIRVGLAVDGELVAVAMAGRPVSRVLDDGRTLEVLRVCTLGHTNACSRLYGAIARAAVALGWRRLVTYTLATEPGSSLLAVGFERDHERGPRPGWAAESVARPRDDHGKGGVARVRWVRELTREKAPSPSG